MKTNRSCASLVRVVSRTAAQWDRDPVRNTMAFATMKYPPGTFPSGGVYGESTLFEQVCTRPSVLLKVVAVYYDAGCCEYFQGSSQ